MDVSRRPIAHTTEPGAVVTRCVADVAAVPVRWLWPGRIARGKITILAGHPGLGKSQITISLAAIVTTGGHWPVDRTSCERGNVLMLSAEDDVADTIRPRLEAAGADVRRVEIIDGVLDAFSPTGDEIVGAVNLQLHVAKLDALLATRPDVALLTIDPITAYLGATDSHMTSDVRALLAPLSALATKYGIAIVLVSHLNKAGAGSDAMLRITGSMAFVAAARAAWIVARDPEDRNRRLMLPAKNNLGKDESGLAFTVESHRLPDGIETSRVIWDAAAVMITADEAMAPVAEEGERTMTEDAVELLEAMLTGGRVLARNIKRRAADAGISDKSLRNARQRLPISVSREGFGAETRTYWSLIRARPDHLCPVVPNTENGAGMEHAGTNGTTPDGTAATRNGTNVSTDTKHVDARPVADNDGHLQQAAATYRRASDGDDS